MYIPLYTADAAWGTLGLSIGEQLHYSKREDLQVFMLYSKLPQRHR